MSLFTRTAAPRTPGHWPAAPATREIDSAAMKQAMIPFLLALFVVACGAPETETATPEPARPSQPDVRGEEIAYDVDGVTLNGYLAYDAAQTGPRPGVLVVHEWWGHNEYARTRARMLAEMGYTALALDMYGDGKLAEHPEDAQKFMMEVIDNLDVVVARFTAARELLEGHETTDAARTAAIGYCFGGAVVLHMTRMGIGLDAVASFHGDLRSMATPVAAAAETRVLVLHGAADPFVPVESVDAFKQEMTDAGIDMRFVEYPDVVHSFTNPGATAYGESFELPLRYDEAADKASWAELEGFLSEVFAG